MSTVNYRVASIFVRCTLAAALIAIVPHACTRKSEGYVVPAPFPSEEAIADYLCYDKEDYRYCSWY